MTWKQFLEWKSFDELEPIGDRRGDWQAASICAAVVNLEMAMRRIKRRFTPEELLLEFDKPVVSMPLTKVVKEEPKPAPKGNWQGMKMIARMHFALAEADKKKRAAGHKNRKR